MRPDDSGVLPLNQPLGPRDVLILPGDASPPTRGGNLSMVGGPGASPRSGPLFCLKNEVKMM